MVAVIKDVIPSPITESPCRKKEVLLVAGGNDIAVIESFGSDPVLKDANEGSTNAGLVGKPLRSQRGVLKLHIVDIFLYIIQSDQFTYSAAFA